MAGKEYIRPRMISREELEQALLEANEQLSKANEKLLLQEQERAALFSNLSHDLRAPMTALTSAVGLLRERPKISDKEYDELLDLMSRRLRNLSSILDDIFLLGQMENPELVLCCEEIEAAPLLEEFFFSCEADARFRERELSLELEEGMDCKIRVDAEKLVRVLDNLFTNALRYSGAGARITLRAKALPGAEKKLLIEVADTGFGISGEDLPHIFERSFRGDRSRTPGTVGHGLGLAIAKSIVERHGGRIGCESRPGEGSRFFVELPEAESDEL